MAAFDILAQLEALTPRNLTIREQTRIAENPNDLRWPVLAPRVDAPSVRLTEVAAVDYRPAGGRREWNAQGREIPEVLGKILNFSMVPINPTHHLDEERLQYLRERAQGVAQLLDRGIVADVDRWATILADAVDRQLEREFFSAWQANTITVMDPKTGTAKNITGIFDTSRYITAATAWNDAGVNAYDLLLDFIQRAQALIGPVGAVRTTRAVAAAILADAPAPTGVRLTMGDLNARLAQEGLDGAPQLVVDARTFHTFTDGGSAYTSTTYQVARTIAAQPLDGQVGNTYFAPVTRAYDYLGGDEVAQRLAGGVTVFHSPKNDGKTLMVEAQANALALPQESRIYVEDTLVA